MSIYIYVCRVCLVVKSCKLLISCCICKVMFFRLLEIVKNTMSIYVTYLKNVVCIQLLRLCGVYLLYINCWIYRKCNLTIVKTCLPCRWPSRAQVERGLDGMHHFLLIYFNSKPLHVSSRFAAHQQEDQVCINSNWYSHALCWLVAAQQPVNITHDYNNCCLYRPDPPDDEQQTCSKHVEVYYWNKLIKNNASYWFVLYGYIRMHRQQNIKNIKSWRRSVAMKSNRPIASACLLL
jgi:hypothetical protein